ncbi:MAG: MFS transporter [Alphaproteobacteria bacterium]|nr:MFS transporter [Alphaproteobacteria bacterium]
MTAETATPSHGYETRIRDLTLIGLGGISGFASAAVAPAMPGIAVHFAGTPDIDLLARLVVALPTALFALTGPLIGWVSDRVGRRLPLILAAFLYAVAGPLPYFLDDLWSILGCRAALGLAMGVLFTLAPASLGDWYEGAARNRAIAWYGAGAAGVPAVMIVCGGVLAEYGWRLPFLLHAVALPLLPPALLQVRDAPKTVARTAAAGATGRLVAARVPWAALIGLYLAIFLIGMTFMQLPLNVPFLLVERAIGGPSVAGLGIAATMAIMAGLSFAYPWLARRAARPVIFAGYAVGLGFGFVVLAFAWDVAALALGLLLLALGQSMVYANNTTWLMAITPPGVRARVIGGMVLAIYAGQFSAPFLLLPIIRAAGLAPSFLALSAAMALLCVTMLAIVRRDARRRGG